MKEFKVLEAKSHLPIRKIVGLPVRDKSLELGVPIDVDSPIGANDSARLFVAFSLNKIVFIDYDVVPLMVGF